MASRISTEEPSTSQSSRPRLDPNRGRWWAATGFVGLVSSVVGVLAATLFSWDLEDGTLSSYVVGIAPLVLVGLATGIAGGLRRWQLIIPSAAAPLAWLGVVVGEGEVYPYVEGAPYWSLVIGTTAVVTVIATWLVRRYAGR